MNMPDQTNLTHSPTNDMADGVKTLSDLKDVSEGEAIYAKIEKMSPRTMPRANRGAGAV